MEKVLLRSVLGSIQRFARFRKERTTSQGSSRNAAVIVDHRLDVVDSSYELVRISSRVVRRRRLQARSNALAVRVDASDRKAADAGSLFCLTRFGSGIEEATTSGIG